MDIHVYMYIVPLVGGQQTDSRLTLDSGRTADTWQTDGERMADVRQTDGGRTADSGGAADGRRTAGEWTADGGRAASGWRTADALCPRFFLFLLGVI